MKARWLIVGLVILTLACNLPAALTATPPASAPLQGAPSQAIPQAGATAGLPSTLPAAPGGELPPAPTQSGGELPQDVPLDSLNLGPKEVPEFSPAPGAPQSGGGLPQPTEALPQPTAVLPPGVGKVLEQNQRIFDRSGRLGRMTATLMRLDTPFGGAILTALFDACLISCQPCTNFCQGMKYSGDPKPVKLGTLGAIRPFSGTCGDGFIEIFGRGNVAVILTLCGKKLDPTLLDGVGQIIDERLIKRLGAGGKPVGTPSGGTPAVGRSDCVTLNLTPEECANSGDQGHDYLITLVESWVNSRPQPHKTPNTPAHQVFPFPDPFRDYPECRAWLQIGQNKYECSVHTSNGQSVFRVTFTLQGFVLLATQKQSEVEVATQTTYMLADAPAPTATATATTAPYP